MQQKRPGGLTALAVINFVFTGFSLLGIAGAATFFALSDRPEMAEVRAAFADARGLLIASIITSAVSALLLLLSGIGYLRQKRVMGRMLGSAYAIVAIGSSLVSAALLPEELGGGMSIGTIIGLLYPGLTLFLLNVTFKDDLVH